MQKVILRCAQPLPSLVDEWRALSAMFALGSLLAALARAPADVGPPDLASLGSSWLGVASEVPDVPIDCPSAQNLLGSVGTCGPTCRSVFGYNAWT